MELINPFEETVVFGKAYRTPADATSSRVVPALRPTGRHLGHGLDLKHVTNSGGGGGPATRLERYKGKGKGLRQGPFGKAAEDYYEPPSAGRIALGTFFGPFHSAVAGREGREARRPSAGRGARAHWSAFPAP